MPITKAKGVIDLKMANVASAGRVKLEVLSYGPFWSTYLKYKSKIKKPSITIEKQAITIENLSEKAPEKFNTAPEPVAMPVMERLNTAP